jgi:hypothetical protein
MADQGSSTELDRALAREDADDLDRQLRVHQSYFKAGFQDNTEENHADIDAVIGAISDPDRSLAYLALATAHFDDEPYLAFLAVDLLEENLLWDPSPEILERVLAEGRRDSRFRWMLSHVCERMIAERARAPVTEIVGARSAETPLPPRCAPDQTSSTSRL